MKNYNNFHYTVSFKDAQSNIGKSMKPLCFLSEDEDCLIMAFGSVISERFVYNGGQVFPNHSTSYQIQLMKYTAADLPIVDEKSMADRPYGEKDNGKVMSTPTEHRLPTRFAAPSLSTSIPHGYFRRLTSDKYRKDKM